MVSVVKAYYEKELRKAFDAATANYCSMMPAFIYSEEKPEAPKLQDYLLLTEEDIEKLEQIDRIKKLARQHFN